MEKTKHPLTINVGPLRDKKGNETLYVYNADDNTWSMVKCDEEDAGRRQGVVDKSTGL